MDCGNSIHLHRTSFLRLRGLGVFPSALGIRFRTEPQEQYNGVEHITVPEVRYENGSLHQVSGEPLTYLPF